MPRGAPSLAATVYRTPIQPAIALAPTYSRPPAYVKKRGFAMAFDINIE